MKRVTQILSTLLVIVFLSGCANTASNNSSVMQQSGQSTATVEQNNDTEMTTEEVQNNQNEDGQAENVITEEPQSDENKGQAQENQVNEVVTPNQEKQKNVEIYLKLGDSGQKVKELQTKLNKFNYKLVVDGEFGDATNFAVKDFQKKTGLTADGVVGPETQNKLDKTPAKAPYLYTPAPSTDTLDYYQNIVNSSDNPSNTGYFIYVNLSKHVVVVLTGSNHNWKAVKKFSATVGASSTPTITGRYTVGEKGGAFTTDTGLICKYYTQIKGDYLFHSILYYPDGRVADARLGYNLSHGCIRLATENAKYIYETIPKGTAIWIKK